MKKQISIVLVLTIIASMFIVMPNAYAQSVSEIRSGVDKMYQSATQMHLADAITPTYDPVPQHYGDSNFYNECTALTYYSMLSLNIHKYTPYGNGCTWYANFPSGKTNLGDYTAIKKDGANAIRNFVNEYGNEIYYLMVGFSKGYQGGAYGHVMFIYAIKDNICYYYDNFDDGFGANTVRRETSVDDFIARYTNYGYTFAGAVYFKPNNVTKNTVNTVAVSEGECYLKNLNAYMSAYEDYNGGNVFASSTFDESIQKFNIYKSGNGYKIQSKYNNTSRVVNVWTTDYSKHGDNVTLYDYDDHPTQTWMFEPHGEGYIIHPADNLGLALTVQGNGNVAIENSTAIPGQIWKIESPVKETPIAAEPTEKVESPKEEASSNTQTNDDEKESSVSKNNIDLQYELVGNDEKAIGIKFTWSPSKNKYGYRIFRSETKGKKGISISDFAITGNEYVDVNIDSYTKYYYTICPVLKEAEFDIETGELTSEKLGSFSDSITITTPEITTDVNSKRQFILMEIGKPTMLVGEETMEIDPGRGTVPVVQNGRTLVPIRAIVEAMGGEVDWNGTEQKVSIEANEHTIYMWLGNKQITVDNKQKNIDMAPITINDRTMLPIRFVAENIGYQIEWIASSQQIVIVF